MHRLEAHRLPPPSRAWQCPTLPPPQISHQSPGALPEPKEPTALPEAGGGVCWSLRQP